MQLRELRLNIKPGVSIQLVSRAPFAGPLRVKVANGSFNREEGYLYFLDSHGDVSRAKRAVGGQKRKKTKADKKPVVKKAAPKKAAPAKKPAAPAAPAKKPAAPAAPAKKPAAPAAPAKKPAAKRK